MKNIYLKISSLLSILIVAIIMFWYFELSIPVFVVFSLVTIILLVISSKYKEINNPIVLYCAGWLIPLSLSQINFSSLQRDYSLWSWVLIIGATIAFIFPCYIMSRLRLKKDDVHVVYNVYWLYRPMIIIAFIIIMAIAYNWYSIGGIPILVGDRNASHLHSAKFINYFIYMSPMVSGLAIVYLILGGKRFRKLMYLIILIPYTYAILQMLRSLILNTIYYQSMFLYIALRAKGYTANMVFKRISLLVFALLLSLVIIMPVIGNYRVSSMYEDSSSVDSDFWVNQISLKKNNATLAWTYSYYCMGFDNLDVCINNYHGPRLYGYNTLLPVIGPTQIKNFWPVTPEKIDARIPRLWGAAVGTYLRELYLDGGIWFAIFITFLFSFIVNYFYYKGSNGFIKLSYFSVYITISYAVIYMFFNAGAMTSPIILFNSVFSYMVLNRYTYLEE